MTGGKTCPNGHLNPEDQHFCGECGAPLTKATPGMDPNKLAPSQSTNVRCHNCQHVQAVPASQPTFVCEKCNTKLKRLTSERAEPRPGRKPLSKAERSAILDHDLVMRTGQGGAHVETRSATEGVDTPPAETPPGPADDALSRRAVAWWKRRSLVGKALIVVGIVITGVVAWHFLTSANSARRERDITSEVKSSMQQTFDTDARFTPYHLVVEKVDVAKQNGNQYQGMATVRGSKGIDHEVPIDITADGNKIMWHSEPGAFVWMVLEQLNPAVPTTGSPGWRYPGPAS